MYIVAAFIVPAAIIVFFCVANRIIFNGDNSILFSDLSNSNFPRQKWDSHLEKSIL